VRYAPFPPTSADGSDTAVPKSGSQPPQPAALPQIGYAIGKKVGNAVVRNRIRRRLRPLVVTEAPDLAPGIYLIGVKNDHAARISHDELHDDLRSTLAAASTARPR
jgi:ribonuclease P protein component